MKGEGFMKINVAKHPLAERGNIEAEPDRDKSYICVHPHIHRSLLYKLYNFVSNLASTHNLRTSSLVLAIIMSF